MSFGYKHVLQRHLARKHPRAGRSNSLCRTVPAALVSRHDADYEEDIFHDETDAVLGEDDDEDEDDLLAQLTGKHYHKTTSSSHSKRTISCPWPHILTTHPLSPSSPTSQAQSPFTSPIKLNNCSFKFSRSYDLRRHLKAEHGYDVSQNDLDDVFGL